MAKPKFEPEEARRQLAEFLDADMDVPTHHPLHPLYQQLLAWEDAQEQAKRDYAGKLGADKGVNRDEARVILSIGSLDSDDDYMLVHTRQAYRLFVGRGRDPEGKLARIPGAKNVGSALRNLWQLSGQDNPYADWMLILVEFEIDDLIQQLSKATAEARTQIDDMAASGMHLSILRSRDPAKVSLGFRSPYGFLLSKLVMDFDMYVRVVKTLTGRNLISADKEREILSARLRPIRAFFDRALRNQNVLQVPAYAAVTRADVGHPKTRDIQDRVKALAEIWPGLPEDVLSRAKLPRHAKPLRREPKRERTAEDTEAADLL
ncbi:TIGR03761 family integrating conjugative element protein [Parasulfuritortus cantonensis]|uniref:TIGR03761 family integrating conjugative element protein n=1 Tax=Parasulfuritortus cantonensis TaxID=2528202 RepID=A0A4V6NB01_9PROT|nr:TIGR03761 family integrating conjugative element protein [Parasulfuritortus cantonensis]TCJ15192.1 TIGR03761 family integrating conjugative element protein [Parasulfuritortus cantonensis]